MKKNKVISVILAAVIILGSIGITNTSSAASKSNRMTYYMKVQKTTNIQYRYGSKWYTGMKLPAGSNYFVATNYKKGDIYAYGYAVRRVKKYGEYQNEKIECCVNGCQVNMRVKAKNLGVLYTEKAKKENTSAYKKYKKYFRIDTLRYPEYVSSEVYGKYKSNVQTYKSNQFIDVNGAHCIYKVPMVKATDKKAPKGYTYYYTVRGVYKLNTTDTVWVKTRPAVKLKNSEVKKLKPYKKIKLSNIAIVFPD